MDGLESPDGPRGVAGLAADPSWRVSVLAGGRWGVAERSFEHAGHQWVVGLTPAESSVALIVWRDEEVVAHARGDEAAMCTAALDWVSKILRQLSS
ncbi:hypothetical protein JOF56_006965 [Kibdelosporangium banguiense]|uniref:Uncharacterized protein n=1 Tax=Kibdelosporangium banguiense TaxID=1365924 RepID=A0ABS4TQ92_9PSEU|nr:hypothetical protein [Kibdelosporangium banguiense]MBP2326580.1 hypothetical protein [Kibdelosporangium banguiense]